MIRKERIEKMLHELQYEIEVGMLQGDIEENLGFDFIIPVSKSIPGGVVVCSFRARPTQRYAVPYLQGEPRLKVIK